MQRDSNWYWHGVLGTFSLLLHLALLAPAQAQEPPVIFVINVPYDDQVPENNITALQNAGLHLAMTQGSTRVVEFSNGVRARYQKITFIGSMQLRQIGPKWSVGEPDPAASDWRERAIVVGITRWPTDDSMVAQWLAQLDWIMRSGGSFSYWGNPLYIPSVTFYVWTYSDW